MFIETPNVIKISPLDFLQFTNGPSDMDLVDITYMGKLSTNITSPQVQNPSAAQFSNQSPTAYQDPSKGIINNPGSYVYRLDLTLDSEKLAGSEVEGLAVQISPQPFGLFIADNFDDIETLSNKSLIIAKELNSLSTAETLDVVIDYRADFNLASNKTLADSAQQKSADLEQKVFYPLYL